MRGYRILFCFKAIESAKKENHFYCGQNRKDEFYLVKPAGEGK